MVSASTVYAVESHGLSKMFGRQRALDAVELRVPSGSIYGFIGRNGAGKTTAIRLMLGLLKPSAGEIRVFGCDVARDRIGAARQVGSLLEARAVYDHLTGRENLDATRRLLGLPGTEIDRVLELTDMTAAAGRRVGHYSLGMRQRLGLARALLGSPRLLVLDEPMNGLDPDGIRDMREVIRTLPDAGVTVFVSSHLLSEIEQTVTYLGLMQQGRLLRQGPIGELLAETAPQLFLRTKDRDQTHRLLVTKGYAPRPESGGLWIDFTGGDAEAAGINRDLVGAGVEIAELSIRSGSLEDLFRAAGQPGLEAA